MSLSGILNGHFVTAWMVETFGTGEQGGSLAAPDGRRRDPRRLRDDRAARGLRPAGDPHAEREGDDYVVTGEKTWITNALRAALVTVLVKTDLQADPPASSWPRSSSGA